MTIHPAPLRPTDVAIADHGSVVLFTPLTPLASEWVEENVQLEGWQWLGASFAADHHCAADLAFGMASAGLEVA